jgi:hypothetical protein
MNPTRDDIKYNTKQNVANYGLNNSNNNEKKISLVSMKDLRSFDVPNNDLVFKQLLNYLNDINY